MKLLEQLSKLADTLDAEGHVKQADDIDSFISDMARVMEKLQDRKKQEDLGIDTGNMIKCPKCEGMGGTKDEPWCSACKGDGFLVIGQEDAVLVKNAFIRKRKDKWCVISKKGKTLGCYTSRKAALKRLRQIEFFKHNK